MSWAHWQAAKVVAGGIFGFAVNLSANIIAQVDGLTFTDIRDLTGGGLLIVVAGFLVRWVIKTSKTVEEKWINEVSRLEKKIESLEEEKAQAEMAEDGWRSKYWELQRQYQEDRRTK